MDGKREERKQQHIDYAVKLEAGPQSAGWEDVALVHQALLKCESGNIDTRKEIFDKVLQLPLVINALTGGAPELEKINGALAAVAKETGIGLAVGSQTAAIRNRQLRHTYEIVRRKNPEGLIMANISALASLASAREAVEMIGADVLQLHLNPVQELLMSEGDRDFRSTAENIAEIVDGLGVPVMVKEVGFGLSRETAAELVKLGVAALDIGGAGGTNFAAIELARAGRRNLDFFREWGISTAVSLLEVKSLALPVPVMVSGGVTSGLDLMKGLALGADVAGIAGPFLKTLLAGGERKLMKRIGELREALKLLMMVTGAVKTEDISSLPLVITGRTKDWCDQRGIETQHYGRRS